MIRGVRMFQKALFDYLENLKIKLNWKKLEFAKVWIFVYMLVILPCMMAGTGKGIALDSYYLMVIPMAFGIYSISAVPIQLPKQMYLCPLEQSERHRYMRDIYWIRLVTPILLEVIFHVTSACCGITGWIEAGLQIYALSAMLICISILESQFLKPDREEKEDLHRYKEIE